MHTQGNTATNAPTPVLLRTLPKFGRVWFDCDGLQFECSTATAIYEMRRRGKTLADVQLVDYDNMRDGPRSRQCQAIVDALHAANLPDPILQAAKAA